MTFQELSSNLNLLMAEARVNANELARRTGIPASSIKKIRNNNNANPTLSTLAPIANYFSITVSQLIGDISLPINSTGPENIASETHQNKVPIILWNEIASWPKTTNTNHPIITTERPYQKNFFGLIIEESVGIFSEGTILLIEPSAKLQQNDYVISQKVNQKIPSIKQVLIEDGEIYLRSIVINHHIILRENDDKIFGVIMEYRKYLR